MMFHCPYCGEKLGRPLNDGITTCERCTRVFDNSVENRVLSGAWTTRRWKLFDPDVIQSKCSLSAEELAIIAKYILELDYTHDEFLHIVKSDVDLIKMQ
jgi:hypothetical protein